MKTNGGGQPHIGNIVFLTREQSIASQYSPLRCTGIDANAKNLTCVANQNNRKVLQVCGKFIDMEPVRNNNCQDVISLDVHRTCK